MCVCVCVCCLQVSKSPEILLYTSKRKEEETGGLKHSISKVTGDDIGLVVCQNWPQHVFMCSVLRHYKVPRLWDSSLCVCVFKHV